MEDELGLAECQLREGLLTLGWIHTHPQWGLFLSSVDLHNQFNYQMQLPEAVAVVYSPIEADPSFKAFRVKDSKLEALRNCKLTGFHQHPGESASRPFWEECRHVLFVDGLDAELFDLRGQ